MKVVSDEGLPDEGFQLEPLMKVISAYLMKVISLRAYLMKVISL